MSISAKKQRQELENEVKGKESRKPKEMERNEEVAIKNQERKQSHEFIKLWHKTIFCLHYSTL